MKGWIGLALVALGIVIAASFGSRNGAQHVAYRQAVGEVAFADEAGNEAAKEAAVARKKAIGLPEPAQRFQEWFTVGGLGWLVGIVFIGAGAGLSRSQAADEAAGKGSTAVARVDFEKTMATAIAETRRIGVMIADLAMDAETDKPRAALDALSDDVLTPMVEGRGQLIAKHGLAGFAQYFGPFSAGERNLNRCWSALTDGHAVVARESLVTAEAALEASLAAYRAVEKG